VGGGRDRGGEAEHDEHEEEHERDEDLRGEGRDVSS
jgi:hypothetical protein